MSTFADSIIVMTENASKILIQDYKVDAIKLKSFHMEHI